MNKPIIAGIAVVILAGGAGAFVINANKDSGSGADTTQTGLAATEENGTQTAAKGKKACELITLKDAKVIIGDNAALLEGSSTTNAATTNDVSVDNCSYSADGATLGDMKQLLIQIHSGNSAQVKQAYENYKKDYPGDAIPELGVTAYYATETKQVNVLKDGNWFFVGAGSMNGGDEANRTLAIQAAKIALRNL